MKGLTMQMIQINETDYVNVDRIILVRKAGDQWKIFMSDYMEFDIPNKYYRKVLQAVGIIKTPKARVKI